MAPTKYARTVRCTDEVMCYCVWYGTVRYGTVLYRTVPNRTVLYIYRITSVKFQENVPYDAAEPAASRTCLFPSPFLRESGGDEGSLHDARNFVAGH